MANRLDSRMQYRRQRALFVLQICSILNDRVELNRVEENFLTARAKALRLAGWLKAGRVPGRMDVIGGDELLSVDVVEKSLAGDQVVYSAAIASQTIRAAQVA